MFIKFFWLQSLFDMKFTLAIFVVNWAKSHRISFDIFSAVVWKLPSRCSQELFGFKFFCILFLESLFNFWANFRTLSGSKFGHRCQYCFPSLLIKIIFWEKNKHLFISRLSTVFSQWLVMIREPHGNLG